MSEPHRSSNMRIGVDLGGTKIESIALAPDGAVLARRRVPTPRGDYAGTVRAVAGLVAALEAELSGRGSVGIGTPGAVSARTGTMKNCNSVWLNGRPLARDLEAALGRPVRLANDANCFALSEAVDGAARGAEVVFGVILGTGVGGGVVVHGRPLAGANAIAGEWGHNPLPWPRDDERPGPPCYCGRAGCIETWLSGPALAADHLRTTGLRLTAEAIAAEAAAGDATCTATLARYAERLGRALAHVVNILDPDVIVLGGGVSNIEALYTRVPEQWARYVFSDAVATRLARNVIGDASGVRGAAWLWNDAPEEPR
jgi:predicted NBD/HSP70 family sugar kinase